MMSGFGLNTITSTLSSLQRFSMFGGPKQDAEQIQAEIKRFVAPGAFQYKSELHLTMINDQIKHFNEALINLRKMERIAFLSLVAAGSCYMGSFLFPVGLVALPCCIAAGAYGTKREAYNNVYRESLEDLIKLYQWVMKTSEAENGKKIILPEVQKLIKTLAPYVSSKTLVTWKKSDLIVDNGYIWSNEVRREDISEQFYNMLKEIEKGTLTNTWEFQLYGEDATEHWLNVMRGVAASHGQEVMNSLSGFMKPEPPSPVRHSP